MNNPVTVEKTTYNKWLACDSEYRIGVIGDTETEAIMLLAQSKRRADEILANAQRTEG